MGAAGAGDGGGAADGAGGGPAAAATAAAAASAGFAPLLKLNGFGPGELGFVPFAELATVIASARISAHLRSL